MVYPYHNNAKQPRLSDYTGSYGSPVGLVRRSMMRMPLVEFRKRHIGEYDIYGDIYNDIYGEYDTHGLDNIFTF